MKKLLALAGLLAWFPLLEACQTEPEIEHHYDTVTVHDTVTIRDTVPVPDTAHHLEGTWMFTRVTTALTENGVTTRDTIVFDTANAWMREFYRIFARGIVYARFSPQEEAAELWSLERLDTNTWIIAGRDTVTMIRTGNHLLLTFSDADAGFSFHANVELVAYAGAFPPPEWFQAPPPDTSGGVVSLTVNAPAHSAFLGAGAVHWYSFAALAGQTYLVRTFGSTDTYLELYNPAATAILAENDDYAELNGGVVWTCPASGTYLVRIDGYSQYESGAYSISVTTTSAALAKPATLSQPPRPPLRLHPLDPGKRGPAR